MPWKYNCRVLTLVAYKKLFWLNAHQIFIIVSISNANKVFIISTGRKLGAQ